MMKMMKMMILVVMMITYYNIYIVNRTILQTNEKLTRYNTRKTSNRIKVQD